jgi:hypothetical protein
MSLPNCFIEILGYCISSSDAVTAAIVAAVASTSTTLWKLWSDHALKDARQEFESSEREARELFETSERNKREAFESRHATANLEAEARIRKNLESYISLESWRSEAWQRNLTRLEQASQQLERASAGVEALIEEGAHFSNLRMIQETAKVLDVFGDFQTSVGHFALPTEISDLARELISHITKVLLTLSPLQEVRQSLERREMLAPLKIELKTLTRRFMKICGDFEHNPSQFIGPSNGVQITQAPLVIA